MLIDNRVGHRARTSPVWNLDWFKARWLAALLVLLALAPPAAAQFADQATYAGTSGGSANAQTITVPNVSTLADIQGVLIKWVPSVANTGSATLAVSGTAATIIRKPGASGLAALAVGELQIGQPVITMYDGTQHVLLSAINDNVTVTSASLGNSALSFGFPTNLQLNATVATNALTIAVKGNNGSDPSATNPVLIPFRDNTIANGDPQIVSLTAALSFTVNSGNTMGCVNAQMCRLWVVAICSSGTACTGSGGAAVVALCAFNALSGTAVAPINEAALQTSQSGTNGGNSAQAYYCNLSAVTARAIRILGYVEIQEATAGTWALGPTYTQLFGPGIKRPADVVQVQYNSNGVQATSSNSYTVSNTPPAPTNGASAVAQAITPMSAANVLHIEAEAVVSGSMSGGLGAFLYNTTSTTTLSTALGISICSCLTKYQMVAGVTTAITFTEYYMSISAGTAYLNTLSSAAQLGGTAATWIRIEEIMGALDPPANDNLNLKMVG